MIIYISEQVDNANSLENLYNLGDLAYAISKISLITRALDISRRSGTLSYFNITDLQTIIAETTILQQEMMNNYSS